MFGFQVVNLLLQFALLLSLFDVALNQVRWFNDKFAHHKMCHPNEVRNSETIKELISNIVKS
jgi:hypothetical protein